MPHYVASNRTSFEVWMSVRVIYCIAANTGNLCGQLILGGMTPISCQDLDSVAIINPWSAPSAYMHTLIHTMIYIYIYIYIYIHRGYRSLPYIRYYTSVIYVWG